MAAAAVAGILLASVTLYALLGGADFGGGLWDLLAGGDRRGRAPRALIEESITPVWEANHVWLIFDLVIFWTAFPHAFAAVMTTAALPLWLAAAGIVLRGAGFAFRKEASRLPQQREAGATFAFSSLLTPFFMGTVIGAIASGQIPANAGHASLPAWTSATSLLTGLLFVGTCSYIAAVYLVGEAAHRGDRSLQHYFTRRAQAAALVTGALSLATLAELHTSNPALFSRLTGRALPLVIIAGLCGLAVLGLLTTSRPRGIRVPAALGVAAVIWGWGVAQYPELLPGTTMTLTSTGTPHATLVAIIWLSAAAILIVGPSYALLIALQARQVLQGGDEETDFPARPGSQGGRDRRTSRLRRVPGGMLRQRQHRGVRGDRSLDGYRTQDTRRTDGDPPIGWEHLGQSPRPGQGMRAAHRLAGGNRPHPRWRRPAGAPTEPSPRRSRAPALHVHHQGARHKPGA